MWWLQQKHAWIEQLERLERRASFLSLFITLAALSFLVAAGTAFLQSMHQAGDLEGINFQLSRMKLVHIEVHPLPSEPQPEPVQKKVIKETRPRKEPEPPKPVRVKWTPIFGQYFWYFSFAFAILNVLRSRCKLIDLIGCFIGQILVKSVFVIVPEPA